MIDHFEIIFLESCAIVVFLVSGSVEINTIETCRSCFNKKGGVAEQRPEIACIVYFITTISGSDTSAQLHPVTKGVCPEAVINNRCSHAKKYSVLRRIINTWAKAGFPAKITRHQIIFFLIVNGNRDPVPINCSMLSGNKFRFISIIIKKGHDFGGIRISGEGWRRKIFKGILTFTTYDPDFHPALAHRPINNGLVITSLQVESYLIGFDGIENTKIEGLPFSCTAITIPFANRNLYTTFRRTVQRRIFRFVTCIDINIFGIEHIEFL